MQVQIASGACLLVGCAAALFTHGALERLLVIAPLAAISVGLALALVHTISFRYKRLLTGHCANPLCHGVVQHSSRVSKGLVVCPTCQRVWPEVPGMRFQLTQRA